jgi:deoxyribonuclease-1
MPQGGHVHKLLFWILLFLATSGSLYVYVHSHQWARLSVPEKKAISHGVRDFAEAKRIAAILYQEHPYTFYCGCRFLGKQVDHGACGYKPLHDTYRAHRVEWEHIVPAHAFGQGFPQWRTGAAACIHTSGKSYRGRACARLTSKTFNQMEADLYNLVPAIGEVNQLRADFPMGMLPGIAPMFGRCRTKIFHGVIEPREEVRGFIARTYLYMEGRDPGFNLVNASNDQMFHTWNQTYPPDAFEIQRAKQIARIQGNENPFVRQAPQGTVLSH